MRASLITLALALAACSPPAQTEAQTAPADTATEAAASVDYGPYANSWDAAEFSRFSHTLHATTPGPHEVVLTASTTSPGGETVAIYPIGPDGEPLTARVMFVIASTAGGSETETVDIPAEGLPVQVAVENASGRRFAGHYEITVLEPATTP